jgi:hypothetical protein
VTAVVKINRSDPADFQATAEATIAQIAYAATAAAKKGLAGPYDIANVANASMKTRNANGTK